MWVKVCGASSPDDIDLLARSGVDLVGLWHGVRDGHAELDLDTLTWLAGLARTLGLEPVMVTFLADAGRLAEILRVTGIRWIQLHAFPPPGLIPRLRAGVPDRLTVVKVLHIQDGECLEARFIGAYERAGSDYFLLDTVTGDGRLGSTGQELATDAVRQLADTIGRPFFLAGGLSASISTAQAAIARHGGFRGIDVDSAARDGAGALVAAQVAAIVRGWRSANKDRKGGKMTDLPIESPGPGERHGVPG